MPGLSVAELGILQGIQNILQCGFLDTVMPVISSFADDGLLWIAMALAFLLIRGQRSTGAQMILALVLSVILCNLWLKHMIDRPRPFEVDPLLLDQLLVRAPGDASFPSGHSSASFAAVTVLVLTKWKGRWAALAVAVLIAFSRLYLRVHFPTDVLGGILVGMICGCLAVLLWSKLIAKHLPKSKPNKTNAP